MVDQSASRHKEPFPERGPEEQARPQAPAHSTRTSEMFLTVCGWHCVYFLNGISQFVLFVASPRRLCLTLGLSCETSVGFCLFSESCFVSMFYIQTYDPLHHYF